MKLPDDEVEVLAITRSWIRDSASIENKENEGMGVKEESIVSSSSSPFSSSSSPSLLSGFSLFSPLNTHTSTSSSSSPSPTHTSPSLTETNFRFVTRKSLVPLDDDLLVSFCKDETLHHICSALIDFSEWDDHLRDSYMWPSFVTTFLRYSFFP